MYVPQDFRVDHFLKLSHSFVLHLEILLATLLLQAWYTAFV